MSRFPKERFKLDCTICGDGFEVVKSRLNSAKFCSDNCRTESTRLNNIVHSCDNCGADVKELATHRDQIKRHGSKNFFCSRECYFAVSLKNKPIGTKRKCSATDFIFVKINNCQWKVEHRIIAEKAIGRALNYDTEPMLHIDGCHYNNDPGNLYICKDRAEINTILKSYVIPYPVDGNLGWYK